MKVADSVGSRYKEEYDKDDEECRKEAVEKDRKTIEQIAFTKSMCGCSKCVRK